MHKRIKIDPNEDASRLGESASRGESPYGR
jgi:hypothetical protein